MEKDGIDMAQIKINNIIYGSSNAADIIYRNTTVEEKLDNIPVFDPSDNQNIEINSYDYLTYGHIVDSLNSTDNNKVLSAKQGKVLNDKLNNIDFSPLENAIAANTDAIEKVENKVDTLPVAKTVTQAEYDAMSEAEKKKGIYVIEDEGNIFVARNIEYDGSETGLGATVQQAIDNVNSNINSLLPFELAIDAEGNYGYKKVGADSVTPFKKDVPYLYNVPVVDESGNYIYLDYDNSIAKAKRVKVTTTTGTTVFIGVSGTGVTTITNKQEYDISNATSFRVTFDYGYGKWTGKLIFE